MTTRRGTRSSSRRRSAPIRTIWKNARITPATLASFATGNTGLLAGVAPDDKLDGWKVLRIIGNVRVNSTDVSLSADFAVGIAFMRFTAPSPNQVDFPWLWWVANSATPPPSTPYSFDVKGQRKFRFNEENLVFAIANNDAAQSLEYMFGIRILLQKP